MYKRNVTPYSQDKVSDMVIETARKMADELDDEQLFDVTEQAMDLDRSWLSAALVPQHVNEGAIEAIINKELRPCRPYDASREANKRYYEEQDRAKARADSAWRSK